MKKIEVSPILPANPNPSMQDLSSLMDSLFRHSIDHSPWPDFPQEPATSFTIAHIKDAILLKFYVAEPDPRITFYTANDPVYKDSCVEFFISWDAGRTYYNLESNAIGTCLIGYGAGRENRSPLSTELIQTVGHYSSLPSSSQDEPSTGWSLTLKIPLEIFIHDSITTLPATGAKANFYKCGDDCAAPHYLAWNNIATPSPDFHQSRFFGDLLFL
jgi:hypothetical protein